MTRNPEFLPDEQIIETLQRRRDEQAEVDREPLRVKQAEYAPLRQAARAALEQKTAFLTEHAGQLRTIMAAVLNGSPDRDPAVERARQILRGAVDRFTDGCEQIDLAARYDGVIEHLQPGDVGDRFMPGRVGVARERFVEAANRAAALPEDWRGVEEAWAGLRAALAADPGTPLTPRPTPSPDLPDTPRRQTRAISSTRDDDEQG